MLQINIVIVENRSMVSDHTFFHIRDEHNNKFGLDTISAKNLISFYNLKEKHLFNQGSFAFFEYE